MKYISIDIETTGLDPEKHQILEFAAVYDDLLNLAHVRPSYLPSFVRKIRWRDYVINEYCLGSDLLKEIRGGKDDNIIDIASLAPQFYRWLFELELNGKYNVAGKNFAGFDGQFLLRVPGFPPWNYRVLDVGSMYVTKDMDELPGLSYCGRRVSVKHRALPDALDVVHTVRRKLL